jgi:hypothetical protein
MPMQFAGIIIEGGIIGFDSSIMSGGAGMRIFGIGKQTQWSQDTVTVSLRAVSVNTGKVLATVTVQKTILSSADSVSALKFFDQGTQAFEAEAGITINEPSTYAVKSTTEFAVVELIKEGAKKGVWGFKYPPVAQKSYLIGGGGFEPEPAKEVVAPVAEVKREEPKPVAVEEKKLEIKVEPKTVEVKKEVPKAVEVKQPETKTELKLADLYGKQRVLKEDSFLFAEENEASQRKWQFKKGTVVSIRQLGSDGWIKVVDVEFKGGWIKTDAVQEVPPEKSGPEDKK